VICVTERLTAGQARAFVLQTLRKPRYLRATTIDPPETHA
jgi:hypothetical protein